MCVLLMMMRTLSQTMIINPNKPLDVVISRWFRPLFHYSRYKVYHGGRGGGKTKNFALALIMRAYEQKINVICAREFQNSIDESVKPALEWAIDVTGYNEFFNITNNSIIGANGSKFTFKGLARNIMSIKGWEDVDICWIEEAHTMSDKSLELLLPTIRKPNSEIWFSLNRHSIDDAVDKMFLNGNAPDNSKVVNVNWRNNPYFTEELEAERQRCLKYEAERYNHIWEGQTDDNNASKRVLPLSMLLKAVGVVEEMGLDISGRVHTGLDVYDGGVDANALVGRRAPLLFHVEEWQMPAGFLYKTVARADRINKELGASRMYYDVGGIGAAVRSDLNRLPERSYKASPFNFGGKIKSPERMYTKKIRNKDQFARLNAQGAWNLRLRLQNTMDFIRGENIDQDDCLFIDGNIENINALLSELSQASYDEDTSGRIKIDKDPEDKGSPNMYDAAVMAFAWDIRRGLRIR